MYFAPIADEGNLENENERVSIDCDTPVSSRASVIFMKEAPVVVRPTALLVDIPEYNLETCIMNGGGDSRVTQKGHQRPLAGKAVGY